MTDGALIESRQPQETECKVSRQRIKYFTDTIYMERGNNKTRIRRTQERQKRLRETERDKTYERWKT